MRALQRAPRACALARRLTARPLCPPRSRHVHPVVSPELRDYIVEAYVDIRAKDKARSLENASRSTTTPRQLLSILRLAEAHAKINMRDVVEQADIDEAIRLIQMSKASVVESDSGARGARADPISRMWDLVKDKLSTKPNFGEDARAHTARSRATQLTATDFAPRSRLRGRTQLSAARGLLARGL